MLLLHPPLSPSPVHRAFPHIEWNHPIAVSKPEADLLQMAEANPLEYTLAEFGDAFAYARLLLKVLDQVTGPSNPGRVSSLGLDASSSSSDLRSSNAYRQQQQQGSTMGLDSEEAWRYLQDDKAGVVTHYVISQLYDIMGLLAEQPAHSDVQLYTIFYQNGRLLEDWRPLLRLLYRPGDAFSQRGAALCLAYILQAGCSIESWNGVASRNGQHSSTLLPTTVPTASTKIPMVEETLQSLISWLTSRLQSSHGTSLGVVTPTLVVLATCPPARIILDHAGGIGYLARHLKPKRNTGANASTKSSSTNASNAASRRNYMHSSSSSSLGANGSSNPYTTSISSSPKKSKPKWAGIGNSNIQSNGRFAAMYSHISVQQLYELAFCLWSMTYECSTNESMRQHFLRDGAVPALADLIALAPREKVVRLALSSLANLAKNSSSEFPFVPEMISCQVLKSVRLLQERKWTDPDIEEDLKVLHDILEESYRELSKWEVYTAELESGQLQWGVLHTTQFFQANARRMEGPKGDFAPLQRLLQLIALGNPEVATSSNNHYYTYGSSVTKSANSWTLASPAIVYGDVDETVAIACFDLGEFVRHYPNGKAIAKRLGAKEVVMSLMDHESPEIQRQALQCISKLLVNNWQAVGPSKT